MIATKASQQSKKGKLEIISAIRVVACILKHTCEITTMIMGDTQLAAHMCPYATAVATLVNVISAVLGVIQHRRLRKTIRIE